MELHDAFFTLHCIEQCADRGINLDDVRAALCDPEDVLWQGLSRVVVHRMLGNRLLPVVVDISTKPPDVVTAYVTSKVLKYWRN